MPRRAFIIHGYLSNPQEAWLPWLKVELEKKDYVVALPAMPHPDRPDISEWDRFIARLVGEPDEMTVMIGHSLGCQGVLRYLENIGAAGLAVAKTVLVAGFFPVGMSPAAAAEAADGDLNLLPWYKSRVDPAHVKKAAGQCTVILSDNDPYMAVQKVAETFRAQINPKIIIVPGQGHFNEDSRLTELPAALKAVLSQDA